MAVLSTVFMLRISPVSITRRASKASRASSSEGSITYQPRRALTGDDAARSQPHQGFAHDGAAAVEQHRKWLLTQARAGG
jgi:hypothetical protein